MTTRWIVAVTVAVLAVALAAGSYWVMVLNAAHLSDSAGG